MPARGIRPFSRGYHGRANIAPLDGSRPLPSWLSVSRGVCPASWQTAPAVDGTTFISYDLALAANTPRYSYHPRAERKMLVVEPTRTNLVWNSFFADVAPANEVPDGWLAIGTADVDYRVEAGGSPTGNDRYHYLGTGGRGVYQNVVAHGPATTFSVTKWVRRVTASGAVTVYTINTSPGLPTMSLGAATHDWARYTTRVTSIGDDTPTYILDVASGGAGNEFFSDAPQLEAGAAPSTWIPTVGASGQRLGESVPGAADVCGPNGGVKGGVHFLWSPFGYGNNPGFDVSNVLLALNGTGNEIQYNWGTQRLIFYYNAFAQAINLAATFSEMDLLYMSATWGPEGANFLVINLTTGASWSGSNGTAWTPVTLAPYLGSRAGVPGQSSFFGDVCFYER